MNSIVGNCIKVMSVVEDNYSYVNIGLTWKGKKELENPVKCKKTQVMWSNQSVFGVVGSNVGDFIGHYGENSSLQEGIFAQKHIAELLIDKFSGLKYNELIWVENPLEKKLKNGKERVKKPKWLPNKKVEIVHLYSDTYIDVRNPTLPTTDFYNVYRYTKGRKYRHTWLMCNDEIANELEKMNLSCLYIQKCEIKG